MWVMGPRMAPLLKGATMTRTEADSILRNALPPGHSFYIRVEHWCHRGERSEPKYAVSVLPGITQTWMDCEQYHGKFLDVAVNAVLAAIEQAKRPADSEAVLDAHFAETN